MMDNKRGVSVWISYVMLTALVVSIGFFVLKWSRDTTEDTVQDIVERGDALTLCGATNIDIKDLCQNTQTLNMDVTNTNDIKVEGLWVRMFDIYDRPQTSSRNTTILPQKTKNDLKIIKQGIIKDAVIMPLIYKDGKKVICESRKTTFENIVICS
ncbi:hypothetical protein CMO88_03680 [Candidatus Woesearchaeota archaeon]|nr:hypothetical protein [Candidatus Woesearchaeota archaeon]